MNIVVFGNGGIAELIDYYFKNDGMHDVVGFTVDEKFIKQDTFLDRPLVPFESIVESYPPSDNGIFIALGYSELNRIREQKYHAAKKLNYQMPSYVSSRSVISNNVSIGDNCLILENQTIQPFCVIGNNVTLWSGNHIGHHSTIGDHTFVASHVVVSGHCNIGKRCFLGVNATLRDSIVISDDAFIGMGSQVAKDVGSGGVVISRPDEVIESKDRRAVSVRRKFFSKQKN